MHFLGDAHAIQITLWGVNAHTAIPKVHLRYSEPEFLKFKELSSRFQGIDSAFLGSLAGRYDNPIPTRFLVPMHRLF